MTTMQFLPDSRYTTAAMVRRLFLEHALTHWRLYAIAFALMAIAAGCTAVTAYPRDGRHAGAQFAHHGGRPGFLHACRADRRDGDTGSAPVLHHAGRLSAGDAAFAQDDPSHSPYQPGPVHRRRAHHGDDAGNAAGIAHRQGFYPRGFAARTLRRQRRAGGA